MSDPIPSRALVPDTPLDLAVDSDPAHFTASLAKGEEAAWTEFHDRYRLRLAGYLARAWHGESASLDDLVQETLLRAVRYMRIFRTEDALWSWLTVLARSAVADHGRRRSRWGRFLQRWRLESELRAIPTTPDRFAAQLEAALAALEPEARTLIEAKYDRRLSVRALAAEHSLTERAIEGRLARARQRLLELLEKNSRETRS